jgi:hypothetical protein
MDWPPNSISRRERAAALIIVLAFVVLLTVLVLAYFTRATSDRPVAHSSFNQSKADELAQSAMDLVIGALRQEITGPAPTPPPPYFPLPNANMLPMRSGNPPIVGGVDPIPNLIRRSVRSDALSSPALPSLASFVNSTTDASANSRSVSLARWNKHYLLPRYNTGTPSDYTPSSPLVSPFNPNPAVANGFTPPDWVILTRGGPVAFPAWDPTLKDQTQSNNSYAVGRYAYAIYDEGGLLDANVVGYPTNTTAAQYGPKGVSAFADLTVTGIGIPQSDIDAIVGWRNYFSASPSGNFPNFNFNTNAASNYVSSVLSNTNGFMSVPIPSPIPNNMSRTDQAFTTRQSLIQLLVASGLSANAASALQYLGTFSRELNAPSWAPTQDASDMGGNNGGGTYAYRTNAGLSTTINPNLLNVRVNNNDDSSPFIRADGTAFANGQPLIDRRFPLTRINGLADPTFKSTTISTINNGVPVAATAATVQRDFGLLWNSASNRWDYVGPTGSTVQTSIERLVSANPPNVGNDNREPNFFEVLKAAILSGSVGLGSGADVAHTATFVAAEPKYWNTGDTTHGTSSDYQIMQIGANIINQWDSGNLPIFIGFGQDPSNVGNPYEIAGIKNLPYLNKIVFKPYWHKQGSTVTFEAWLLPSLWNPHQNAPTQASENVRVQMTLGTGASVTATATSPSATSQITSTQYVTFDASASTFGTSPSAPTSVISGKTSSGVTPSPDNYWGFDFPVQTLSSSPSNSSTAYPNFGTSCTFEVQVDVTGNGNWKSYQKWSGCAQPPTALVYSNPLSNPQNDKTLQDPEFVALDPRTVRFGVWGNDGKTSGTPQDYSNGTQLTLDSTLNSPSLPVEVITALPPQGSTWFTLGTSPYSLYQYANNGNSGATAPHYTDLDLVQRLGDFPTAGDATDPANDELQQTLSTIRPLALNGAFQNGVFQSVAELGHVFRAQPWKTLNFTSAMPTTSITKARSADAGLLDVFTLHESSMEAGKTSLNTRQAPVLKAILSKAALNLTGTSIITPSQIDDGAGHGIVPALMKLTVTGVSPQPMINKAELVTRLAADSSVTGLGNKEARECVIRAFSDACQTRTWNLMIDVIAQSGRYPPNASTLAGFLVEGEQHYWVHVAIDRFTGQVIDKQIEVVNE